MNDRHPSGNSSPGAPTADASYGYPSPYGYEGADSTWGGQSGFSGYGGYTGYGSSSTTCGDLDDPLFGPLPGTSTHETYETYETYEQPPGYGSAYQGYGTDTPAHGIPTDFSGYQASTGYSEYSEYPGYSGHSDGYGTAYGTVGYGYDATATIDALVDDPARYASPYDDTPAHTGQQESWDQAPQQDPQEAAEFEPLAYPDEAHEPHGAPGDGFQQDAEFHEAGEPDGQLAGEPEPYGDGGPSAPEYGSPIARDRRRRAAKRSALLTVAVPSVAVMGVAAVAAATVSGAPADTKDSSKSQADGGAQPVANTKLDTQLANLTADADDFADRASRTQERIDLKQRQEEERKRKEAEARRREALRPKFLLPVKQQGLSAYYGQAGVNWMSLHTGIDFPVDYGTPVMAATDGMVSVKWGGSFGNMAVVTTADGTETWYCHLSSTKIRSGPVKAGDVIAYSGNSGNSTGPHLHFEVHPGGGSAIDPLPWLLNHGLDPR